MDSENKGKINCLVCGNDVVYLDRPVSVKCHYCGLEEEAYIYCKNDHYVCDKCHANDALEIIENVCLNTDIEDPIEIAEILMEHPKIRMHGPEHHALTPAVLITAYQNYTGQKDQNAILEGIKRGKKVPGGNCGFYGACGGGLGVGIAVSVLLEATPLTPGPRSHASWATSRALKVIADAGGARCCKKAVRISLEEGATYISDLFGIDWGKELDTVIECNYTLHNKECDSNCRYRGKKDEVQFISVIC